MRFAVFIGVLLYRTDKIFEDFSRGLHVSSLCATYPILHHRQTVVFGFIDTVDRHCVPSRSPLNQEHRRGPAKESGGSRACHLYA